MKLYTGAAGGIIISTVALIITLNLGLRISEIVGLNVLMALSALALGLWKEVQRLRSADRQTQKVHLQP